MGICSLFKKKYKYIEKTPKINDRGSDVHTLQTALYDKGFSAGRIDGVFGNKTLGAVKRFQKSIGLTGGGVIGPKTLEGLGLKLSDGRKPAATKEVQKSKGGQTPWMKEALRHKGKHETRDKSWAKWMASKWHLVGLKLPHISKSYSAWCGLAIAVALAGAGIDYQKNGALARNWRHYGVKIDWRKDGIPKSAIVHLNNKGNCNSSSSNHVSMANGDCTAKYLTSKGATIVLYGGNQGNTWKTSTYSAYKICNVRWPKDVKDYPKPPKVLKNVNCTKGKDGNESTR